jgi:2-dehydropantoate 2-reductase
MVPMKILVYGAGVVGTLYAARLQEAGHQVTVLARNSRLADVRRHGLVLEDVVTGVRSVTHVSIVDRLYAEDSYDIALVTVRKDQLSAVMPDLVSNTGIPTVLFMLNNPLGSAKLVNALGPGRVLLGFPGAGGELQGHIVRYAIIAQQPTNLGEASGRQTVRLLALVKALRASGFRTRVESDMDAWLSSHAFFVTSITGAMYLAGGDCDQLSRSRPLLKLMVSGVREGFRAVRTLGSTVRPLALRVVFMWLPSSVCVYYWQRFLSRPIADHSGPYFWPARSSRRYRNAHACFRMPPASERERNRYRGFEPTLQCHRRVRRFRRYLKLAIGHIQPIRLRVVR